MCRIYSDSHSNVPYQGLSTLPLIYAWARQSFAQVFLFIEDYGFHAQELDQPSHSVRVCAGSCAGRVRVARHAARLQIGTRTSMWLENMAPGHLSLATIFLVSQPHRCADCSREGGGRQHTVWEAGGQHFCWREDQGNDAYRLQRQGFECVCVCVCVSPTLSLAVLGDIIAQAENTLTNMSEVEFNFLPWFNKECSFANLYVPSEMYIPFLACGT